MKQTKWLITILINVMLINTGYLKAQTTWICNTVEPATDVLIELGITNYQQDLDDKTVRLFIHIVRQSSGSGGLTVTQVNNAINTLTNDYGNEGIYFHITGEDYIDNSAYYNFSAADFNNLIGVNSHDNSVDVYFLPPTIAFGRASNIPGKSLVLGGAYAGTSVLSHEMGHCLGLYHTHSGRGCGDYVNCEENINGTNCLTCGDLVCDTPADPCLSGNVDNNCQYTGDPVFTPDVENIMSYTPPNCMVNFTDDQFNRSQVMLENSSLLADVIIYPPDAPYSLSISGNIGGHPTLTWSATTDPDLSYFKIYRKNGNGSFNIIATINSNTHQYTDNNTTIGFSSYVFYYVRSSNVIGQLSSVSNTVRTKESTGFVKKTTSDINIPIELNLYQNYPNPFNPVTSIFYSIPNEGSVEIGIFNLKGERVRLFNSFEDQAGHFTINWNGADNNGFIVPSGVYLVKLSFHSLKEPLFSNTKTIKISLIK